MICCFYPFLSFQLCHNESQVSRSSHRYLYRHHRQGDFAANKKEKLIELAAQ